eukprot:TRINITY_DN11607_c0_g1_i1.p1 TRINITY_DN11607_c0_g1~~TRINITY_DN11607_c0_g1_i1.p1  ORF type:complete len:423 (+),score=91.55 TRINITY_DN11607_c0_g1_i1:118-1269(+)
MPAAARERRNAKQSGTAGVAGCATQSRPGDRSSAAGGGGGGGVRSGAGAGGRSQAAAAAGPPRQVATDQQTRRPAEGQHRRPAQPATQQQQPQGQQPPQRPQPHVEHRPGSRLNPGHDPHQRGPDASRGGPAPPAQGAALHGRAAGGAARQAATLPRGAVSTRDSLARQDSALFGDGRSERVESSRARGAPHGRHLAQLQAERLPRADSPSQESVSSSAPGLTQTTACSSPAVGPARAFSLAPSDDHEPLCHQILQFQALSRRAGRAPLGSTCLDDCPGAVPRCREQWYYEVETEYAGEGPCWANPRARELRPEHYGQDYGGAAQGGQPQGGQLQGGQMHALAQVQPHGEHGRPGYLPQPQQQQAGAPPAAHPMAAAYHHHGY